MVTVDYLKYGAVVVAVAAVYFVGYSHAETEGELAMEELKHNHALAIIEAQEKEKAKYEKDIANLLSDLDRLRSVNDRRVLELEQFRSTSRDLETCNRERNDLAVLSVRGEELLQRAVSYLKAVQP